MADQEHIDDIEKGHPSIPAESRGESGYNSSSSDDVDPVPLYEAKEPAVAQTTIATDTCTTKVSQDLSRNAGNVLTNVVSRITTRTWPEPSPPPDGGIAAWTQVAMGWLVIFCTWGWVNSFGSFQTYYTSTLPQSPSTISWIGSIQVWSCLIISVFSGRLLDAGLFTPTFLVGATIQILGIFLMSISNQYWSLMLTQGLLTGIGCGIIFTPSVALVTTYFDKRRGLAIGLTTTGNSAGGIIYPLVVRQLIPTLGFAWTSRVLAFINIACLTTVFIFMRPRLLPRTSGPIIDFTAFRELTFMGVTGGIFANSMGTYFTYYYIASYGKEALGLSYSSAAIMVILINGSGIIFRVIPPLFADRIGPVNVMCPVILGWAIVAYCWLAVDSVPGLYIFTCFYGIFCGSFQCLVPVALASVTKRLDTVGTRIGMGFSISSFAALTGPPIGGAIQAANGGSFKQAQAWAASMNLIAFLCFAVARIHKVGWTLKVKC
ncbi:MFS general substrate transporter [Hypoxylon sp. NC1633]|nr:MFS general substrate transporter [Hypoxylon sp. NC1633]